MLFLAYYVFDEKKLIENPEGSNGMLLTNVHQFESSFRSDPNTTGKFDMSLAIKDFEDVLDDSSTFASMFEGMKDIHRMIFSMVGERTDTSSPGMFQQSTVRTRSGNGFGRLRCEHRCQRPAR